MASKFAGDIIAGGFARGLNVGTTARQTFSERLGVQLAQRQRDLSYQNFQNLQQRNRQTFMKEQQLKRLGQQEEQFMMSHQLAQDVEGRQIAENVTSAKQWNAQMALQKEQIDMERFKNNTAFFENQMEYGLREMGRIDPSIQPDLYERARQQYVLGRQGVESVIAKGGVQKGYGPALETIKRQGIEMENKRRAAIRNTREDLKAKIEGFIEIGEYETSESTRELPIRERLNVGTVEEIKEKFRRIDEGQIAPGSFFPTRPKVMGIPVDSSMRLAADQIKEAFRLPYTLPGAGAVDFSQWDIDNLQRRALWDPAAQAEISRRAGVQRSRTIQENQMSGSYK